ncbi:hypothetical protein RND71_016529 [Anisodus tanguticus]|uniref:Uncharacterized protein n=1 Tax=Anisodus tanguticus TaxID=243964 RepID=A0AAE1VIN4_9SOLA|nr:hypothetical protein RND71_016529 [Anisodus tanguticus]
MDIDQYEDNQKHLESCYGVEIPQDLLKSLNVPTCSVYQEVYFTIAEKRFKPGFFGSLDGVIVLPRLSLYPYMSIFRIQVRNAVSLCGKKVVVYPSAAVFRYAWRNNLGTILEEGGHAIKRFVEDLVSRLSNVEVEFIVYIDHLLGTNELSFRIQKISDMAVVRDIMTFKESLRKSRIFYQIEKEQAKQISKLSATHFDLVKLLDSKHEVDLPCVLNYARKLLGMLDLLVGSKDNYWREQVPQPECLKNGVDIMHERVERGRYVCEAKFSIMRIKLVEQVPPVQVVAKTMLKSIDGHCMDEPCQQATSFLVLGLKSKDRCLLHSLSKYFVTDDGVPMLVEVDLSACTSSDCLFRFDIFM